MTAFHSGASKRARRALRHAVLRFYECRLSQSRDMNKRRTYQNINAMEANSSRAAAT
jgi:hypothetical protein